MVCGIKGKSGGGHPPWGAAKVGQAKERWYRGKGRGESGEGWVVEVAERVCFFGRKKRKS